jgi:hypothetical protein
MLASVSLAVVSALALPWRDQVRALAVLARDAIGAAGRALPFIRVHCAKLSSTVTVTIRENWCTVATMTTAVPRPKRTEPAAADESVSFSVRFPGPLYNQINQLSKDQERTLNAQIVFAVREWLAGRGKPQD